MKSFVVVLGIFLFSSFAFAQVSDSTIKPSVNFAGKWKLDKRKSDSGVSGTVDFADSTMVVTHDTHEIVMISTSIMDGHKSVRKSVYSIQGGPKDVDAIWDGEKLVRNMKGAVGAVNGGGRSPVMEMREEWTLSKDGRTLTQTITGTGIPDMPDMKSKFIYSRVRD